MASPQSSVDMDISDGSDLDRNSVSGDMEIGNTDEEITQKTENIALNTNGQHPSSYLYMSQHPEPFSRGVTSSNSVTRYQETSIPTGPAIDPIPTGPAVDKIPTGPAASNYYRHYQHNDYQYQHSQHCMDISSTTSVSQADISPSAQLQEQPKLLKDANVIGTAVQPIILDDDNDEDGLIDNEEKEEGEESDDNSSISSFVTAPLYIVNETEEEPGLIRDEDEDDMETLGWYKHQVTKVSRTIEQTQKEKRALEQELLRLQVRHSMEKNKLMSTINGMKKNEKKVKPRAITPPRPPSASIKPITSSYSAKMAPAPVPVPSAPVPPAPIPTPSIKEAPLFTPCITSSLTPEPNPIKQSTSNKSITPTPQVQKRSTLESTPSPKPQVQKRSALESMPSPNSKVLKKACPAIKSPKLRMNTLKAITPVPSPPKRTNAITVHNSSSKMVINPVTKKIVEHHSKGAFKPYESPLQRFGLINTQPSTHMNSNSRSNNDLSSNSSTFSLSGGQSKQTSNMDVGREMCKYETVGGTCNDDTCQALHFRDFRQ